jgi:alkanesulfonate monooxygenase SsuD/methylene tetrahydromethanopterin reductase-like flavin-dependent oxidoreductase (luciferase family)
VSAPTLAAIFTPDQAPERLGAVAKAADAAGLAQLLLHGHTVTTHGRYVHLDDVALDWPPLVVPPLVMGGIRPRTISLAGELADGVIIPGGHSPQDVRRAVGRFRDGRSTRNRSSHSAARSTLCLPLA